MRKLFLFLALLAIPGASWAQSDVRPEILVLGTYHMANPGHDVYNMQVDDVLAPKRQQEIAQISRSLVFLGGRGSPRVTGARRSPAASPRPPTETVWTTLP